MYTVTNIFPFSPPPGPWDLMHYALLLCTQIFNIPNEIKQYFSFCEQHVSLSIMFSTFIHVAANSKIFFKVGLRILVCMCMCVWPFIYSSTDKCWHYFHILAIINHLAVNTRARISLGVLYSFPLNIIHFEKGLMD